MIMSSTLEQLAAEAAADGIQQFVVGAVIQRDNTVLLLRRPSDDFMGGIHELPSGKVEPGETLVVALGREVKEETGLDLTTIEAYLGSFDYTSGSGKQSRQFNFAIKVTSTGPVVLREHDSYQWAELVDPMPVTDAVNTILRKYQENISQFGR